jgi:ABC-type amino acid transport substrate-binding protein
MKTTTSRRMVPGIGVLAGMAILCASAAFLAGCGRLLHRNPPVQESVFGRIMRTQKIRAAWMNLPPGIMKDPATGKMKGIFVEILSAIAEYNHLQLEWMPAETAWIDQVKGLESGDYDIVGSPVWSNPTRGKFASLSIPVYYSAYGIYVRQNDPRFSDAAVADFRQRDKLINNSSMSISVVDDGPSDLIAVSRYPVAKRIDMPKDSSESVLFPQVVDSKADLLFADTTIAYEYQKANPGKLKNIGERFPAFVQGNCFMFKRNEFQLKQFIDANLSDFLNHGAIETILSNPDYEKAPDFFYRVAFPYMPGK